MKKKQFFLIIILGCITGALIFYKTIIKSAGLPDSLMTDVITNIKRPFTILLLQIISIIVTARLMGFLFRKMGQPTVIGEIIAGIVLGPSLLGLIFPQFSAFLFPLGSLDSLHFLSQIGLILFLFIIGMELDTGLIKNKADSALIISFGSILFPFIIGILASLYLYPEFSSKNSTFFSFAVFMGISMSITAFPVLARIIQERQLTKTHLGTMAITVAAVNDVVGWCMLAAVIAIIKAGNVLGALTTIGLTTTYVLFMFLIIRPFFRKVGSIYVSKENLNKTVIALVFLFLLISAYITEAIGIHALFGAFIAGVVMPKNINFRNILIEKIEDVSLVLLLPLFFVFTGLRTQVGLLNDPHLWFVCLFLILLAIIGKFGGTVIFAKLTRQNWKESLALGVLMNTRGLMELIVLNIGYDLGIISAEIFTMLVIMAIVTTIMTGPLLNFVNSLSAKIDTIRFFDSGIYKILLSFANPQMGSKLLKLAFFLSGKDNEKSEVTAVHITPASGIETKNISQFEKEVFDPIITTANDHRIKLATIYRITEQIQKEIISITRKDHFDLLLVGAAKSVFVENFIGGKIKGIIDKANCNLGIFIDREILDFKEILIIADFKKDRSLLELGKRILKNPNCHITIADNDITNNETIRNILIGSKTDVSENINIINTKPHLELINQYHLVILSLDYWKETSNQKFVWNNQQSSLLIIRGLNEF